MKKCYYEGPTFKLCRGSWGPTFTPCHYDCVVVEVFLKSQIPVTTVALAL